MQPNPCQAFQPLRSPLAVGWSTEAEFKVIKLRCASAGYWPESGIACAWVATKKLELEQL